MSFEIAVQQAIHDQLAGNAPLMALVTGIYDEIQQDNSAFPYVQIGEAQHTEFDTDTTIGELVTATIHVWSRTPGKRETKAIQGAIFDALNRASLTATGFSFITCERLSSETFKDADGITRHGVQQFKIILETA